MSLSAFDQSLLQEHSSLIGVDEAGRGALVGPVVAAATLITPIFFQQPHTSEHLPSIKDSKLIKPSDRQTLYNTFLDWQSQGIIKFAAAQASVDEIATHNILGATQLAMNRAIASIIPVDTNLLIIVDGKPLKKLNYPHQAYVKGDNKSLAIAIASIIAKVTRDALMVDLHNLHPQYAFNSHKGYGTTAHRNAIKEHGPLPDHRKLFLRNIL